MSEKVSSQDYTHMSKMYYGHTSYTNNIQN